MRFRLLARPGTTDPGRVPLRRPPWTLRRLLAAGTAAAAVAAGLHVLAPGAPPTSAAVVLTRDLPSGHVLVSGDVRAVRLPRGAVPAGALGTGDAVGRALAGPAGLGEVVTAARLAGPGLLTGQPPGRVAAPVRVADAAAAALAEAGSRVDVLVAAEGATSAQVVATDATVLAASADADPGGLLAGGGSDPSSGGLLVLSVTPDQAAGLAAAAGRGPLMITLR